MYSCSQVLEALRGSCSVPIGMDVEEHSHDRGHWVKSSTQLLAVMLLTCLDIHQVFICFLCKGWIISKRMEVEFHHLRYNT